MRIALIKDSMASKNSLKWLSRFTLLTFLFTISVNKKWCERRLSSIEENSFENVHSSENLFFRLERRHNEKKFQDRMFSEGEFFPLMKNPHLFNVIEKCDEAGGKIEWLKLNKETLETCAISFRETVMSPDLNLMEGVSLIYYSPRYLNGEVKRVWMSDDLKSEIHYELFSSLK